jgi:glycosyltransferase involved in cell wall biosynthesis
MTLCTRNEGDIIRTFLDYHFARGVAHIVVRDTGSSDLTLAVLREYAATERLTLIEVPSREFNQGPWATEMARYAISLGADFVLHSDADEFWWPHHDDLPTVFRSLPPEVNIVAVERTNFLPAPGPGRFWERMTHRDLRRVNSAGDPLRPKLCHRASADVVVDHGALSLFGLATSEVYCHPHLEILHYPVRSAVQLHRKVVDGVWALDGTTGLPPDVGYTWRQLAKLAASGGLGDWVRTEAVLTTDAGPSPQMRYRVVDHRLRHFLTSVQNRGALGNPDVAVIIPVYGQHHLTHDVISDLRRDGYPQTLYVVDNGGDYEAEADEIVYRPAKNLHWAGGCNAGLLLAQDQGHPAYILLNNDTRLSPGFLDGLVQAWRRTGAGLVGPVYDRNWPQQRADYQGPATNYQPAEKDRPVPFLDGTCLLVPHDTLLHVGFIDEHTWPRYGWGCDKDYALRVRHCGGTVAVTERSFLNHLGRQTASRQPGYDEAEAEAENDTGMAAKWGAAWRDVLYGTFQVPRAGLAQLRLAAQYVAPDAMRPLSQAAAPKSYCCQGAQR